MSDPAPTPAPDADAEAKRFHETLVQTGQLVDVKENEDTSKLPARVTHVRYPDGRVKRIRFTGQAHR
jgi:allantoicase